MDLNVELDLDAFEDVEIELDSDFECRYIKPPKTHEIEENYLKYASAEKLAQQLDIHPGARYFVVLNGTFYFGDFIEALIVQKAYKVKKMTISTLSMCENNVDSLGNLLHCGFVDELNLIISDYFFSHERHNLVPYIYQELDVDNRFQLAVAGTHCKLCIFETHCGKHVVVHGSANLRSSGNIEQIVVEESKDLYDFNGEYQDRIIDKYKTINKAVRGTKLWQAVQADTQK